MRTENENWGNNYEQRPSRDGYSFEKRNAQSSFNNSRGVTRNGSDGYQNRTRPNFTPRNSSNERPYSNNYGNRNNYGEQRNTSEQRPYENRNFGEKKFGERNSNRPYQPRENNFGNRNFDGGDRERRPYTPRTENGDRPAYKPRTYENRNDNFGNRNYGNRSENYGNRNVDGERNFSRPNNFVETKFDGDKKVVFRKRRENEFVKIKKVFHSEPQDLTKHVRLNKYIANAGICSRREADDYIRAGVISVNGEIVTALGMKVLPTDKVKFHDQTIQSEKKVYVLLNKPKDCVTTTEDQHAKITVLDIVRNACSERIYPVGRLDRNTTGVLLITNDGDLASRLAHPKYDKKKIYHATLDKDLTEEDFKAITEGVELEDGIIAADALEFVKDDSLRNVGIEIHSGKNRVVRRIFDKLGYRVIRLDRVYFAGLTKKNLPRGKYRFLSDREISMLKMGAYE